MMDRLLNENTMHVTLYNEQPRRKQRGIKSIIGFYLF
jgi:hypothetical protein